MKKSIKVKSRGASKQWGSGWIDIEEMDFKQGDKLTLTIGGDADKIIIRLLHKYADPNEPVGIIEDKDKNSPIVEVPESRVVEIKLSEDHSNVRQISVHGMENPWGIYFLGQGNGSATLMSEKCESDNQL